MLRDGSKFKDTCHIKRKSEPNLEINSDHFIKKEKKT